MSPGKLISMKANWKAYQLRFFGISTSASLSAGSVFRASIHTDRTRCCHMARLAKRNASRASRVRRVAVRLKIAPEMVAERERLKMLYVFPARKSGKTGKGHISLSGLENCHNDVLEACKEKGRIIPFVLYDLRHTFATRAAQGGMPLPTLASILGHSSLRQVEKYVHPTQDHQRAEMDRLDRIRQESKQQYGESVRSQAHGGPAATRNPGDFHRPGGNGGEIVQ